MTLESIGRWGSSKGRDGGKVGSSMQAATGCGRGWQAASLLAVLSVAVGGGLSSKRNGKEERARGTTWSTKIGKGWKGETHRDNARMSANGLRHGAVAPSMGDWELRSHRSHGTCIVAELANFMQ